MRDEYPNTPYKGKLLSLWLGFVVLLLLIDQTSKIYIDNHFQYAERFSVIPSFFDIILVYNQGAAFSLLADSQGWQRWLFLTLGLIAAVVLIGLILKSIEDKWRCLSFTLILAGAIGNVLDRIFYGHVIDFLLVYWRNHFFPAFNVADICITLGAALLIYLELFSQRTKQ